jgi:hypothetical protein
MAALRAERVSMVFNLLLNVRAAEFSLEYKTSKVQVRRLFARQQADEWTDSLSIDKKENAIDLIEATR